MNEQENEQKKPGEEPLHLASYDIEGLSRNIGRAIEEGGKAMAAYLRPREDGRVKAELSDEVADAVKTLGHLAEYWLKDPQRALEAQIEPGAGLHDALGVLAAAHVGRGVRAGRGARCARSAVQGPGMDDEPVLRHGQAGLSDHRPLGGAPRQGCGRARAASQAQGRFLRPPALGRAVALEFRRHQSGAAARDARRERREPCSRPHTCWRRTSQPAMAT